MGEPDEEATGEGFLEALEGGLSVLATVVGYRAEALRQGFSAEAAEQLALHFHNATWQMLTANALKET